ncbi:hypothetical protein [Leptolyngbya sp. FACHB-8]|uniref:hypothetical protein n=1 Tax=unclassified Leptolyngbya TaxID=2650499 RepID=UPI001685750C|nr:hypothetical protein [Leptolyngbya sp. FACHB-8]MBD2158430.1 hypothetical protein [Leptolyngbya sp. FACHB-16]
MNCKSLPLAEYVWSLTPSILSSSLTQSCPHSPLVLLDRHNSTSTVLVKRI